MKLTNHTSKAILIEHNQRPDTMRQCFLPPGGSYRFTYDGTKPKVTLTCQSTDCPVLIPRRTFPVSLRFELRAKKTNEYFVSIVERGQPISDYLESHPDSLNPKTRSWLSEENTVGRLRHVHPQMMVVLKPTNYQDDVRLRLPYCTVQSFDDERYVRVEDFHSSKIAEHKISVLQTLAATTIQRVYRNWKTRSVKLP